MERWRIPVEQRPSSGEVEVFCDRVSAPPGATVRVFASGDGDARVTVWRLGHCDGHGGRLAADLGAVRLRRQAAPRFDPESGLVSCSHWEPSARLEIPAEWRSGVYAIRVDTSSPPVWSADAILVVTPREAHDVVVVLPVTTWAAYNPWGGRSLYDGGGFTGLPRADAVSFDRPMKPAAPPIWETTQGHPLFTWEYPLVRWVEREGFDVAYITNLEFHRGELPSARLLVSAGHDEYWSAGMRDALDAALQRGTGLFWAGANGLCWNIRLEASPLGPDRTLVCFKDHLADPVYATDPGAVTGRWGEWPLYRSESDTLGVRWVDWDFSLNRRPAAWIARAVEHPLFRDTGFAAGDRVSGIVGDEWDALDRTSPTAAAAVVLGETEELLGANLGPSRGQTVLHRHAGGGLVLATGTTSWCWGLDASTVEDRETAADARLQRLTRNFFTAVLDGAD